MKKFVLIIVSVFAAIGILYAQNVFFSMKEGQTLLYAHLDKKGDINNYTRQTVTKIEGSGQNFSINYVTQLLDKNRKPIEDNPEFTFTITVINNVMELDLNNFGGQIANFAGALGEASVEITGDKIKLPASLKVGDKLNDARYTITVNMDFAKFTSEVAITQHECIAIEDIKVPAGAFKCYKLTHNSTATAMANTAMAKTITNKTLTWYASGVGVIKSETYDSDGKLQSGMQLQSIEK